MWLHAPILPSFPVFLCMHIAIFIFNLFRRRLSIPDTELSVFVFEKKDRQYHQNLHSRVRIPPKNIKSFDFSGWKAAL